MNAPPSRFNPYRLEAPQMKVKDHYLTDLAFLEAQLERAYEQQRRLDKPAHMVGNCPSDVQDRDAAHRLCQKLEYQINCLKNDDPIY